MRSLILCLCLLLITLTARGEEITATVTAYNQAELEGDVPANAIATFLNTYHSKGTVRKGDTATLVITQFPKAHIHNITAFLRSNKASGAGNLTITCGKRTLLHLTGNYNTWQKVNAYSTEYQPFTATGNWQTTTRDSLILRLIGTTNSIHLSHIIITYSEDEKEPCCINFHYTEEETITLCEEQAGEGITLPDLKPYKRHTIGSWQLIGWSTTQVNVPITDIPQYYRLQQPFFPEEDMSLYPLYRQQTDLQFLPQDTIRQSSEYALVAPYWDGTYHILYGPVDGGYLQHEEAITDMDDDSTNYLIASSLTDDYRYRLSFTDSKLFIEHVASQTPVGYSGTKLSSSDKPWQTIPRGNHTLFIVSEIMEENLARGIYWMPDARDKYGEPIEVYGLRRLDVTTMKEAVYLYDVSDLPKQNQQTLYLSYPAEQTLLPTIPADPDTPRKFIRNGLLFIQYNGKIYYGL